MLRFIYDISIFVLLLLKMFFPGSNSEVRKITGSLGMHSVVFQLHGGMHVGESKLPCCVETGSEAFSGRCRRRWLPELSSSPIILLLGKGRLTGRRGSIWGCKYTTISTLRRGVWQLISLTISTVFVFYSLKNF